MNLLCRLYSEEDSIFLDEILDAEDPRVDGFCNVGIIFLCVLEAQKSIFVEGFGIGESFVCSMSHKRAPEEGREKIN